MLCARECPDWCLYIDSHKEPLPPLGERGRPRVRHVLDRFAIDFSLCMYCGICIEVCPFDALFWTPDCRSGAPGAPISRPSATASESGCGPFRHLPRSPV